MSRARDPATLLLGAIPLALVLAAWFALPRLIDYPAYMLPPLSVVGARIREAISDGSLVWASSSATVWRFHWALPSR